MAGTAAGWLVVFATGHGEPVTPRIGLVAGAALVATALVRRPWLRERLRGGPREALIGLALGVALVAATRAAWPLATALWPALGPEVDALYSRARAGAGPLASLPWILLALTAEEVVYRGLLFDLVRERIGGRGAAAWAIALSTLGYAASHAVATPLLALIAAAMGLVWAIERALLGGLLAPLLTHAIWTLATVVFLPLR